MIDCHPVSTPADFNSRLSAANSPTTPEEITAMSDTPYSEAIGCLT